jgi:hypothetical protein
MSRRLAILLSIASLGLATPDIASSAPAPMQHFSKGEAVSLIPDKAYLMFRIDPRAIQRERLARYQFDFVFVSADALLADPKNVDPSIINVFQPYTLKPYDMTPDAQTILVSLPPGRYVLAGVTGKGSLIMGTCLCMGTVSFEARAGVVTDLGYLIDHVGRDVSDDDGGRRAAAVERHAGARRAQEP